MTADLDMELMRAVAYEPHGTKATPWCVVARTQFQLLLAEIDAKDAEIERLLRALERHWCEERVAKGALLRMANDVSSDGHRAYLRYLEDARAALTPEQPTDDR